MSTVVMSPAYGTAPQPALAAWLTLRYFNFYRLLIGALFVSLLVPETVPSPIGVVDIELFKAAALTYLGVNIATLMGSFARWPRFAAQLTCVVVADIVALTVMMYASGGVNSGFGLLIVVAVAGGSLLSRGRVGLVFAALATAAVFVQQAYLLDRAPWLYSSYAHASMLGGAFFASALIGWFAASRVRASEALVAKRDDDLATLAQLNEHIIDRMQSGVLATGPDGQIRLMNQSAQRLLGVQDRATGSMLEDAAPKLDEILRRWMADPSHRTFFLPASGSQLRLQASIAALGPASADGALVFLEDGAALVQRAQNLKMASVGRLAGSIAHEIRNPMSAIRHASQLLGESRFIDRGDRRLLEIIGDNTSRMNTIVENVMQISRGKPAEPVEMQLKPWLMEFREELERNVPALVGCVDIEVEPEDTTVRVDASQLHQVVWNLTENALQHTGDDKRIVLRAGVSPQSERPHLDVQDNGSGVRASDVDNLFEPFFTTRPQGSGLGLYVARGLCEGNQATLDYVADAARGACFRIAFNDPRRETSYVE
ncbi:MAG: two-component system sensor histidine kinase NtrB [Gammaproteobacteria bacterium]